MSIYIKERATLLDRALRSILVDQTTKPSELVLVEDGPLTEELYRVIDKYKSIFPSFISVKLPANVGLGRALNAGLNRCRNEWVTRMDSDDISLPTRFEKQLEYIRAHPDIDVLGCALGEFETDEHIVMSVKAWSGIGRFLYKISFSGKSSDGIFSQILRLAGRKLSTLSLHGRLSSLDSYVCGRHEDYLYAGYFVFV